MPLSLDDGGESLLGWCNEWIPNPRQSGVLPCMRITAELVEGWQLFLNEFEALLQGKKLIPHWRFDQGVNLRRIFLEPTTFDIVLLLQGSAAIEYLEDGELSTGETWDQITRIFGGDFFEFSSGSIERAPKPDFRDDTVHEPLLREPCIETFTRPRLPLAENSSFWRRASHTE